MRMSNSEKQHYLRNHKISIEDIKYLIKQGFDFGVSATYIAQNSEYKSTGLPCIIGYSLYYGYWEFQLYANNSPEYKKLEERIYYEKDRLHCVYDYLCEIFIKNKLKID